LCTRFWECKGKENMDLFPEDLTIFREIDTKGSIVESFIEVGFKYLLKPNNPQYYFILI